jgi:hypothetical protein
MEQIATLERERDAASTADSQEPAAAMMARLASLQGIGPQLATLLVRECFARPESTHPLCKNPFDTKVLMRGSYPSCGTAVLDVGGWPSHQCRDNRDKTRKVVAVVATLRPRISG